ncbi:adenylyl-sulfate kinase [Alistipes sp. An116]|uniref:adenylyl-sulfate kinase n=1 Tax=unclassified Alistipes TaxID=2608932 RepID=UPI000B385B04|nr:MULTISPECIES: adenylyl-sulfate kinase [unclassified Alistipes]OUN78356.1 adenylyl-sulfate kinase [Alistipes sp. An54]OUQ51045.1 adenylyl-sulfate kinase [Alistipes sp. An116]
MENIHPIFDRMESRAEKERQLGHRGAVVWFTGLSGSGKSTLAIALERALSARGILCRILDGDNVRCGINAGLGFSEADRRENIRRVAEVCRLFVDTGVVVLACFVSPTRELRQMAAGIVGERDFLEVYVSTPLAECERRDVKGLYAKARRGEIRDFTGISAPFEEPDAPALRLDTSGRSVDECVDRLLERLLPAIELKKDTEQQ